MVAMNGLSRLHELYDSTSNVLFEEENFLNYRPGGFHPVALGDSLGDGRYKIRHKLGFGGFSTVWLARDIRVEQWVSIKINRADRTSKSQERSVLRALAQCSSFENGSEYIVRIIDDFMHEGPNGCHQCFVFELLGPTLNTLVSDAHLFGERLDTDVIIRISTQILKAVAFMHDIGFVNGDISIHNVAFCNRRLSKLPEAEIFEALGHPEPDELTRVDGQPLGQSVPSQLVQSAQWTGWPLDDDEDDENIRIIDFGEAYDKDAAPVRLAQPDGLQAPETIFTGRFDYRQDLWRVGLVIYQLVFGTPPWSWWGINPLVEAMIDVLGKLPPEWEERWEKMKSEAVAAAKEDLNNQAGTHRVDLRLERQFEGHIHERKLSGLCPVIQGLTKFLPSDRISASEALQLIRDNCNETEVSNDGLAL